MELRCHPETPCDAVEALTVTVERGAGGRLDLRYRVTGAVGRLALPALRGAGRAGELWRTTCFELFVRAGDGPGYREYNFAPSLDWAAYAFDGYRVGMRDLPRPVQPHIERNGEGIEVDCALAGLPAAAMRIALTAVIEESGGHRSFWSLAHPPGAPDFHHDDCFVARLAAPERP